MSGGKRRSGVAIVWFRRDLRLSDHPALVDALARFDEVVPLYVLDPRLLEGANSSRARSWFLVRSLAALDEALRERGSGLVVRRGRSEVVVPEVAREFGAGEVTVSRDVTPWAYRRDAAVAAALEADGRRLSAHAGTLLVEPEELLTGSGRPYAVFSPFWRALQSAPRRQASDVPQRIPSPASSSARSSRPEGLLSIADPPLEGLPEPGEEAAIERLARWISSGIAGYRDGRDRLAGDATSQLGQDLHFGLLSVRAVEAAAMQHDEAATAFVRQLAWREFYHHRLFHRRQAEVRVSPSPFMSVFRSERDDPAAVAAWKHGQTGIPVVDAGMRQLQATAWLSNRARLVVASFLTRHLLMDYRIGEQHFLQHLIDGDVANNLGGWEWTAGVGADPQPWFRIFNPVLQGERFDPEGTWVRRWVPELELVPDRYVHAPWRMPGATAAEIGFVPGATYPRPIIDLREGRERALAAFLSARGAD